MSPKKRAPGKRGPNRRGLSGNPARRAKQLEQRAEEALRREVFGRDAPWVPAPVQPAPWWPESHEKILTRARAATWPARLLDAEALTGRLIAEEFHERLMTPGITGLNLDGWLDALAETAGEALHAAIADTATDGTDWPQLWAFLCGMANDAALLTLDAAAGELAEKDLTPAPRYPALYQPNGTSLLARDAYGSRFLLMAPFGLASGDNPGASDPDAGMAPDHWYAWDLDWCALDIVVAADAFGSPEEALAEWRAAVGPVAVAAELQPCPPDLAIRVLDPALDPDPIVHGSEPKAILRENSRLRLRARFLASYLGDATIQAERDLLADSPGPRTSPRTADEVTAFLDWHAERSGSSPEAPAEAEEAVATLVSEWGPLTFPDDRVFYSCSPHRIEVTGTLLRDGYLAGHANEALQMLPAWTKWCIERSGLAGEAAELALQAARAQAADLASQDYTPRPDQERDPFCRQE